MFLWRALAGHCQPAWCLEPTASVGDPGAYAASGAVSSPLEQPLLTGVDSFVRRPPFVRQGGGVAEESTR